MPIRVNRRDKPRDRAQPTQDTGLSPPLAEDPDVCYDHSKLKFRLSCGSSESLLDHSEAGHTPYGGSQRWLT